MDAEAVTDWSETPQLCETIATPPMKTDLLKRPTEITPHLCSVELNAAGDKAFYCYDGQGERVRKVVKKSGGVVEERRYMGGYEVYRKTLAGATILQRTTHNISDGNTTFCRMERLNTAAPVLRYQYANHLGSASLELDAGGLLISYAAYRPFGTTSYRSGRTMTEVSLKRYHYCGKERDEESGLYYYGARFYADWLVRFVSVDPMAGERQWLNPYNYCQNNPVNRVDPDGALDDDPPKGTNPDLFEKDSDVVQSNSGSKFKTSPFSDSQSQKDNSNINNIGSVYFANKETENILRDAMKNDAKFAEKIKSLIESKMTYTFDWQGELDLMSTEIDSATGSFGANKDTGEVVIGFETYKNGTELGPLTSLYHETQHAIQFERGDIGFKNINGKWKIDLNTYDILDEVEAFDAGYNSPGYNEYHANKWNNKSLSNKVLNINRKSDKYYDAFKMHGIRSVPVHNHEVQSKSLFRNNKYIRMVCKEN